MNSKSQRKVSFLTQGQAAMDGAGVRLTRIIGNQQLSMLDPFLLLDCFESDDPNDYIAGFPAHPHRGFETVTYLLAGRMRHQDSAGNEGVIEPGGVQWMTAGKGIIHSEMPEQEQGLLKGFQLWVNLPAAEKMCAPHYQEFRPDKVALEQRENGSQIRVISGKTNLGTQGPVINEHINPLYLDAQIKAQQVFTQEIFPEHNCFIYLIQGQIDIAGEVISAGTLAVLAKGEEVTINAEQDSRFLLLAAKPLNEPVVRAGPFVMNSREQLMQAYEDFQTNNFLK